MLSNTSKVAKKLLGFYYLTYRKVTDVLLNFFGCKASTAIKGIVFSL